MKRILPKILLPFFQFYWFVFRPKTAGAKCIVKHENKILMIKNNYGRGNWTFPGGKIEKDESPNLAAIREVWEEVEIKISAPQYLGNFLNTREYKRDTIHCFTATVAGADFKIDPLEITVAQWFSIDQLPKPIGYNAKIILELYAKK